MDNYGCGGAGRWLFNKMPMSQEDYLKFLVDERGLKASHSLMNQWLDYSKPYQNEHPNILIGPLKEKQFDYLKTITFYVNPDQLSALLLGAQYNRSPIDSPALIAPFGSGCKQMVGLFKDFDMPQAVVGTTDIAMRHFLPPDILAFTVTKSMFKQLCELDEHSFLYKSFWNNLTRARGAVTP